MTDVVTVEPLVVLVPSSTLLERPASKDGTANPWSFLKLETEIMGIAPTGPQDVYLNLVFPELPVRGVDFPSLLLFLGRLSDHLDLRVDLTVYASIIAGGPVPQQTLINNDKPAGRRLIVKVIGAEVFAHFQQWSMVLGHLGLGRRNTGGRHNLYLGLTELLDMGLRHKGNPSTIRVLTKGQYGPWVRHLPMAGTSKVAGWPVGYNREFPGELQQDK